MRERAVEVLGILSILAGRGIAPYLKHLLGPWMLARHDLQVEVATAAKTSLGATFPEERLKGALRLYSEQVRVFPASLFSAFVRVMLSCSMATLLAASGTFGSTTCARFLSFFFKLHKMPLLLCPLA